VAVEPVELELARLAAEGEVRAGEAGERDLAPRAAADAEARRLGGRHLGGRPQRRVVVEVAGRRADARRLRMRRIELAPHLAPAAPPGRGVGGGAHLRVQREDPALPVQELEQLVHRPYPLLPVTGAGTSTNTPGRRIVPRRRRGGLEGAAGPPIPRRGRGFRIPSFPCRASSGAKPS